MPSYHAPLEEMQYLLFELFEFEEITALPGHQEMGVDLIKPILNEAAKICEDVLFPLNHPGDLEGCTYHQGGSVSTPTGFKDAYDLFCQGGWPAMACDPDFGGMGLPKSVTCLINEMMCSANLSFGIYPGLSYGAYKALFSHATDELKQTYLPQLVSGKWCGTMCLTEPHSGTDLGLIRTKAIPEEDHYLISGTKIFISCGEHDLSENILHLVLAKLPDAPAGTKGISLFLVPKRLDGQANHLRCEGIEHKMGIKASSTCVMNFDQAKGWLVGEPHQGMSHMFTMMNQARLDVGIQGLGLAEVAYQNALAYSKDREQGRSLSGIKAPDRPADPIIHHPDVRRLLLSQKATIEGMRALAVWVARAMDVSFKSEDELERLRADEFVQLMTPVIKALFTDLGFENTNMALQLFGGHGYIRDYGMEQYVRDSRIAQIYEGTNAIQALDLIGRKLAYKNGRLLRHFFHPVETFVQTHQDDERFQPMLFPLAKAFGRLQKASGFIAMEGLKNPQAAASGASEYLRLFGLVALGYLWAKMAQTSMGKETPFHQAKCQTAQFFMEKMLPQTSGLMVSIMAGQSSLMDMEESVF